MIKLIKSNVERVAETEEQAEKLKSQGFECVTASDKDTADVQPSNEVKSICDMTVKELRGVAKEKGIELPSSLSKDDIIKILEAESGDCDADK